MGRGENVVVSTGTASGKSLIFQAVAFHKALLAPKGRTLVFYPLKALAADQMRGWQSMAHDLDLPDNFVGRIDGSVPVRDREEILTTSRIVVMTPDVCHAWLMYRLALPAVREFVCALSTLVMDEAHTLEGVFGSNFAFLIRRLIAARTHLVKSTQDPLQMVAATATIRDPAIHMGRLTGTSFTAIDDDRDGSPRHRRVVAHVGCPEGDELSVTKALHVRLLQSQQEGSFITFLDSRKGVEALAVASGDVARTDLDEADVLPYRAGYDVHDRATIEARLQAGSLRGVISTSALELGIDLPHLQVGINVGVPTTRKSYRQRLGRVGRNSPGCFLVVAAPQAFSSFGTSFREYHDLSVEPSYLYLDNRFMQFAHGRCLATEQESLGVPLRAPHADWPDGFNELYAAARPGGSRPPEFDAIAALGGDNPHHGYPLRNVGELSYQIIHKDADSIGDLNQVQALREAYPGGTYLHLATAYEVKAWVTSAFDAHIRVTRTSPQRRTRPRVKTWVNTGVGDAVQDGNLLTGDHGFLAESMMQITQRVEGYIDERSGKFHDYRELQQRNPNLRAQSRNFRTTGVVLGLDSTWFRGGESNLRQAFANKLRDVFVREYSVAARDVGVAWSNISVQQWDGESIVGGCVAIFDETYGSLRLTERVFGQFGHLLDRIVAGTQAEEDEKLQSLASRVKDEVLAFTPDSLQQELQGAPKGYEQVFTSGSTVCYRKAGAAAVDVVIIQPAVIEGLWYQVKIRQKPGQNRVTHWIRASDVEPSANTADWGYGWWNLETQEYEDPPNVD